jgi:D-glycero-D-manno-heptose 1,7-bisphosphate phosphatase
MAGETASGPRDVHELAIPPGTAEQMERLRAAGFLLLVVSNQPDVARGTLQAEAVERINQSLVEALGIDGAYWCPHDNADGCSCRKPLPGLIHDAAGEWDIDLSCSYLIGDRWVDLAAAHAAGVDGVLLECPHSWHPTSQGSPPLGLTPCHTSATLSGCVDFIVSETRRRSAAAPPLPAPSSSTAPRPPGSPPS